MRRNSVDLYFNNVTSILQEVLDKERDSIEKTASLMAKCIAQKRSVFAFGCNHAGLITLELFYRTGGLVTVNPIRAPGMMLEITPITSSSKMERMQDYGKIIFDGLPASPGDLIIIHSVSGRNNVTIDMAAAAKAKGLSVVVLTNLTMAKNVNSRHPSGKKLHDFGDIVIDNHGDDGDASVKLNGFDQKVAPTSTAVGAVILNSIVARTTEILLEQNITPPIFKSGNVDGGDKFNAKIIEEYKDNIFYM